MNITCFLPESSSIIKLSSSYCVLSNHVHQGQLFIIIHKYNIENIMNLHNIILI